MCERVTVDSNLKAIDEKLNRQQKEISRLRNEAHIANGKAAKAEVALKKVLAVIPDNTIADMIVKGHIKLPKHMYFEAPTKLACFNIKYKKQC